MRVTPTNVVHLACTIVLQALVLCPAGGHHAASHTRDHAARRPTRLEQLPGGKFWPTRLNLQCAPHFSHACHSVWNAKNNEVTSMLTSRALNITPVKLLAVEEEEEFGRPTRLITCAKKCIGAISLLFLR